MAYKRFQNTVAESQQLLPVAVVIMAAACYLSRLVDDGLWMQLVCLAVTTALLVELNVSNQLLRVASQSSASMFLLLSAAAIFLFPLLPATIMQLCMVAVFFMLFHCRQHHESPGWTFYGFFCLSVASMVFVQVLYYVPVLWLIMAAFLRSMTARTFWASVLGVITPYWLAAPAAFYFLGTETIIAHFQQLGYFAPLGIVPNLNEHEWLALGWTLLLALTGTIHYLRQGYQDKIRTRLLHQALITMMVVTLLFLFLQPQHFHLLLSILIVCAAPLIAHFLTLTHTWLTNIAFYLIFLITLIIIVYNVWMPSSNFLSVTVTQVCSYLPL